MLKINYRTNDPRHGKVLVLLTVLLPVLVGMAGLVFDGGTMMCRQRDLQAAVDAAALAAAAELRAENDSATAESTAQVIFTSHGVPDAELIIHIPPTTGEFAGRADHVEAMATSSHQSHFMHAVSEAYGQNDIQARAVAGVQDATEGAAIHVLDPDPADLTIGSLSEILSGISTVQLIQRAVEQSGVTALVQNVPIIGPLVNNLLKNALTTVLNDVVNDLWSQTLANVSILPLPTLLGGLEVEGLGQLKVDGAILVNTRWGGEDENGKVTGIAVPPPYGVACMPLLATTRVSARDIRVSGGVDKSSLYKSFTQGGKSPLQANRLSVPDPFNQLPVPSVASDSGNFIATVYSPADVVKVALPTNVVNNLLSGVLSQLSALLKPLFQPLLAPLTELLTKQTLHPGIYNSLTVLSPLGGAKFEPGIYIIRGKSSITNVSLCIIGPVEARGVLFYITDSSYNPTTGFPDESEDHQTPPPNILTSVLPSTLILPLIAGAQYSGLDDAGSPFDGMLLYQHRLDRRPIIIEAQHLLGGGDISGTVYSKWGHIVFVGGMATYDLRLVSGTMRIVTATTTTFAPEVKLPPAQDVLLLE